MNGLAERVAKHRLLGSAPPGEHAWLIEHGSLKALEVGDVVTAKGEPAKNLLVVLDGHLVIRVDRGAGSHKIFEWRAGDVGGVMPYSRGAKPPGDVVAEEPTELIAVPKECLNDMIRHCPEITAILVHAMVDRARQFTSSDLRDEKLLSLGKLSAGLAHELNNPAAAVMRGAKSLDRSLSAAEHAARALAQIDISVDEFSAIEAMRKQSAELMHAQRLSPLQRADREDEITDWLSAHSIESDTAAALADNGVTVGALDTLAVAVRPGALRAGIEWIAACSAVRALSSEIENAATRISDLVGAVKRFSYMDRAPTPEAVDVRKGIDDTLTMLNSKTRSKSAKVSVSFAENLHDAYAIGAELNQVWMNLIDNALDAVAPGGNITVKAENDRDRIVVSVIDDGQGIPEEIQSRIFDPFFTTKGVGEGTGLGLDVVRRLLQRHDAEISVESRPGHTEFQVRVPVCQSA